MGAAGGKGEGKFSAEIEEILTFLLKLLQDFPENRVHEISAGELYKILHNMLHPNTASKFRVQGFSLLLLFMSLRLSANLPIDEVLRIKDP